MAAALKKTGRPLAPVSETIVAGMAKIGCTNLEIAEICGVSAQTIETRFQPVLDKNRAQLKQRLRHKQIQLAMDGNPALLIWLGKQLLDQKDKTDVTSGGKSLACLVLESVKPAV